MRHRYPVDHDQGQYLLEGDRHHRQIVPAQPDRRRAQKSTEAKHHSQSQTQADPVGQAIIHSAETNRIGTKPEKGRLRQVDLSAKAQHHGQPHHSHRIGHGLHQNIGNISVKCGGRGHIDQHRNQRDISEKSTLLPLCGSAININHAAHAFSATRSPKMPCGRNTRKATNTKNAKPSL